MWLHLLHPLAVTSLVLGVACALWLAIAVNRHPPHMTVMRLVWPICALFGSVFVLAFYLRHGRDHHGHSPRLASIAKGSLHCGAGCTLGDLIAETLVAMLPVVAVAFGWHWLFTDRMFATWVLDCVLAFGFGVAFQYFAIVPMRGLAPGEGIKTAIKADSASLAAWQVGMFGVMALFQFVLFPHWLGRRVEADSVEFWWAMQLAMLGGFVTSFPVNAWLIRRGIKEAM